MGLVGCGCWDGYVPSTKLQPQLAWRQPQQPVSRLGRPMIRRQQPHRAALVAVRRRPSPELAQFLAVEWGPSEARDEAAPASVS
jgi:hypothetical protein